MRSPPTPATHSVAIATASAYALVWLSGTAEAGDLLGGFIPARVSGYALPGALPVWITPISATLLHGGIIHLGFNMLMLIFCGRMVEAAIGSAGMLMLYLAGAYASAGAQYVAGPYDLSPMIGASGAISAVFAGYALLYGKPRSFAAHPALGLVVNILWLAVAWIGVQFLMGFAFADLGMAIATAAHVGGFIVGLVLVRPLLMWRHRGN